ncbi:hypothetical protein [Vibrio lentus]|uniref:hypothetical protein n=1 Tax=Vibrio lentus TaxID=136468 RepID=UPI000C836E43|nr:hypothetical protein [Vibrio lentus]PMM56696.1 hypothetical protein BCT51_07925 [Vibrio lentus]
MPRSRQSISISQRLNEEIARKGNEAIFTTMDKNTGHCFENNIYADKWKTGSGYSTKDFVPISILDESELTFDEQLVVRETLSMLASKGMYVVNMLYAIVLIPLKSLDIEGVTSAVEGSSALSKKIHLRAFFSSLARLNPRKYTDVNNALKEYSLKRPKRDPWDIRTGSLSSYEMTDLVIKLNDWASVVLDESRFQNWRSGFGKGAGSITYIGKLNQFVGLRLAINYHLRPEQIRIIKWSHFTQNNFESAPFLFNGEGYFFPRYVKQKDDEPVRPVASPFPVSLEFSQELKVFYEKYFALLKQSVHESSFDMSDDEIIALMIELPLVINEVLFNEAKKYECKHAFVKSVKNTSWFMSQSYATRLIAGTIATLRPCSDRLPDTEYTVNSRRLRHYAGTVQSAAGVPVEQIAASLTHSTLDAVKQSYIDIPPDVQAEIDNKRTDSGFLVAAATGVFAEELRKRISNSIEENEAAIEDLEAGELGKSASLPMCKGCSQTKPISCYGCHSFKPLATGNHRHFYTIVKAKHKAKKKAGYTGLQLAMLEHQMHKIAATIHYCDLALKALSNNE